MPECPRCRASHEEHARFCSACGQDLRSASAGLLDVRKHVTVIFCDLVDSTGLGERLDPERLTEVLQEYFDLVSAILRSNGGTVREFIGDAVMAVFGMEQTREDDALRALRSALEILGGLEKIDEGLGPDVRLQVRIGVNTGEVLAGRSSAGQPLLLGDGLNVAARLERLAEPGEVLLGEETYHSTRGSVETVPHASVQLRGRREPVTVRGLVRMREPIDEGPFVGRTDDLGALSAMFDAVLQTKTPTVALVLGEAGLGKSRLVREFGRRLSERARILSARCSSDGSATFAPLIQLLQAEEADDEAALLFVSALRGSVAPSVDEAAVALARLLEVSSVAQPTIVVIEDLHWASDSLVDLISSTAREAHGRIMFLVTTRPGDGSDDEKSYPSEWSALQLVPLSDAAANALIEERLPDTPPDDRHRIVSTTRGNPLFIIETARSLNESRGKDGGDTLPTTIRALLDARLDRLPSMSRRVLETASVIGDVVDAGLLTTAGGETAGSLDPAVRSLLDRSIIVAEESNRLAFSHPLVREAAYRTVPKRRRAKLHVAVADAWSGGFRDGSEDPDLVIGQHLATAVACRRDVEMETDTTEALASRASDHLFVVAKRTDEVGDAKLAGELYVRVVDLLPTRNRLALDAKVRSSLTLAEAGRWEEAGQAARDVEAAAIDIGDQHLLARARVAMSHSWMTSLDPRMYDELPQLIASAIEDLGPTGDHEALSLAWFVACIPPWNDMQAQGCLDALERSGEHARLAGRSSFELDALSSRAACWLRGPTPAEDALRKCDQLLADVGASRRTIMRVSLSRAELLAMLGRFDEAWSALDDVDALIQRMFGAALLIAIEYRFHVHTLANDPQGGLDLIDDWQDRMPPSAAGFLHSLRARCLLELQRDDEAGAALDLADELAHPADRPIALWRASLRGLFLARAGDHERAVAEARRGVALAAAGDFLVERGDSQRWLAEVLWRAGDPSGALTAAEEALAEYRAKGIVPSIQRTEQLVASLQGDRRSIRPGS